MKDKPIYLWPFIIVYKTVKFIVILPFLCVHYIFTGFLFSLYIVFSLFMNLGIYLSYAWWMFLKSPYILITKLISKKGEKPHVEKIKKSKKGKDRIESKVVDEKVKVIDEKKEKANLSKLEKKNLRDQKLHDAKMEKIRKKEALLKAKEDAKLKKIEEKKKKDEEIKAKEEAQRELKEQRELLKKAKAGKKQFEKSAYTGGTVSNDTLNQKDIDKIEKNKKKKKKSAVQEARDKIKEEKLKRKKELREEKKKLKDKNVYINENMTLEKKSLGDHINDGLEAIIKGPATIFKKFKKAITNNALVKDKKNQDAIQREALLIDFDGDDAKKSDKKLVYEYVGKNAEGKLVKSYFEAFSKVEVHSFLLSEGFEVYSIKTNSMIQFLHGSSSTIKIKFKNKDLIFFLTQLSTYIKAGIPLVESLRILSRQFKNKSYEKIFRSLIYDLTMGDNFSDALAKQGSVFPRILVNMVKTSEMTGELPETLDDMESYFTEMENTKKQMITALTYPTIIFVFAIAAMVFIMVYIVPKFVTIYADMDNAELPGITVAVLAVSHFLKTYYLFLIIGVVAFVGINIYLYKNVRIFKTLIQWTLMHLPVVGEVIIYNEVTTFTKTFASLLRHNVFITDSMEILNKITNNEIWKMIILDTITNLAKGDKISLAFQDHWAVPLPAYEMIVTGERTGQLPEMMKKVSEYYQELHKNAVSRIKAFVEPIIILLLTGVVGVIVLSIVIPMFNMYESI